MPPFVRSLVPVAVFSLLAQTAAGASRIKDLADVEGVRENMLIGYGLVVGLDGTGDRIRNTPFTREKSRLDA